jgi:hypothetical protein
MKLLIILLSLSLGGSAFAMVCPLDLNRVISDVRSPMKLDDRTLRSFSRAIKHHERLLNIGGSPIVREASAFFMHNKVSGYEVIVEGLTAGTNVRYLLDRRHRLVVGYWASPRKNVTFWFCGKNDEVHTEVVDSDFRSPWFDHF